MGCSETGSSGRVRGLLVESLFPLVKIWTKVGIDPTPMSLSADGCGRVRQPLAGGTWGVLFQAAKPLLFPGEGLPSAAGRC